MTGARTGLPKDRCLILVRKIVPATGRSLIQRSPTEYGVSGCDL